MKVVFLILLSFSISRANYVFNYGDKVKLKKCDPSQVFYNICGLTGKVVDYTSENKLCKIGYSYEVKWIIEIDNSVLSFSENYCQDEIAKVITGVK